MGSCIRALCNANVARDFKIGKDVSLPVTHIRSSQDPRKDLAGKPASERPILVFFAGGMHGYLRPILLQFWENKEPDMKIFGPMPRDIEGKTQYRGYMKSSKYCISARGYEVHTPRIVEAIYYECVPVIISDNYVPPFFEVLDWEAFSVFILEEDIPNLRNILLSIPEEKYLVMQQRVKMVQRHFLWHKMPVKYDLFHMILHSVWYNRVFSGETLNVDARENCGFPNKSVFDTGKAPWPKLFFGKHIPCNLPIPLEGYNVSEADNSGEKLISHSAIEGGEQAVAMAVMGGGGAGVVTGGDSGGLQFVSLMLPYGNALLSLLPEDDRQIHANKYNVGGEIRHSNGPMGENRSVESDFTLGKRDLENSPEHVKDTKAGDDFPSENFVDSDDDFVEDNDLDYDPLLEKANKSMQDPSLEQISELSDGVSAENIPEADKTKGPEKVETIKTNITSSVKLVSNGSIAIGSAALNKSSGGAEIIVLSKDESHIQLNNNSAMMGSVKKKMRCDMPPKSVMPIYEMNQLLVRHRRSSRAMRPRWSSVRDQEIVAAKLQIENARTAKNDGELHAPLFRNVSWFRRSYELMERTLKIYVYKDGEKPIFHQPILKGLYASEGWFMKLMEGNKQLRMKQGTHMEHSIKALCNADVTTDFKIGRDVSLPETYVRSARNPLRDLGGNPPSKRHILAFYAGNMHGYLRPILLKHWKDKDPDMKIFGPMPPGVASKMNYIQHMKSSKYCICPKGHEVNSPRVVESIFYECVPVIISDNFVPPFFEVLDWGPSQ
ncbi:exostosin family protein [Actinidia rufa]|uniref:Exostosin family protein n=1 Tax=Actinidia rufa TaxID=165716 RepID=A0A7J0DTD5_9ERIC|nr:exostosin family protein [Actinidia rufa]